MLSGFLDRGPTTGEAEIAAFEGRCGFRLPADYRRFLLEQNGGERAAVLDPDAALMLDGCPRRHRFFSLGAAGVPITADVVDLGHEAAEGWPELLLDLEAWVHWGRAADYPPELLPIAQVYHGELLLLRLAGEDAGAVYFAYDPDGYCEWHCDRLAGSCSELLEQFEFWKLA
ncbi:MAG: cell-wall [Armatimonadetes bacterium]|nr:cell-wall [Armatimonadota bacterium]